MIQKSAEKLIQSLGITTPEEIDLEAIAMTLGVSVRERQMVGCEARIIGKSDRAVVSINSSGSRERKRFSLGHELGHWQLHRGMTFKCLKEDIGNPANRSKHKEREADNFSANLLMPWFLFKPIVRPHAHASFNAVEKVADRFKTSMTATAIRLVESNLFPAIVICHSQKRRLWFNQSQDVPKRWFPKDTLEIESSAFTIAYGKRGRDLQHRKVNASVWFDHHEAADYEVWEQSIPYGKDKVLTLVELFEDGMLDEEQAPLRDDNLHW